MKQWIVGLGLLIISSTSFSGELYQYDQLKLRVYNHYPADIVTIKSAAEYLLAVTDYRVVTIDESATAPRESGDIGDDRIGALARVNQMMTIEQALWLLIGKKNQLVVDHAHKLVSFESRS